MNIKQLPLILFSGLLGAVSPAQADRAATVMTAITQWNAALSEDNRTEKYCKMASSPYYFFRGTNHLFWQDFANDARLATYATAQTATWLQGDLHAYNFGSFANDSGMIVYDLNDFDEAVIANYQYDVWRMAVSLVLIANENNLSTTAKNQTLDDFSEAYLDAMADYHGTNAEINAVFTEANTYGQLDNFLDDVGDDNSRSQMLSDWTHVTNGDRVFDEDSDELALLSTAQKNAIIQAMPAYGATLSGGLSYNASYFQVKDVAQRLSAGTGSLGSTRYYVLIEGGSNNNDDDRILDVKYQTSPSAHHFLPASQVINPYLHHAQRHAIAYKALGYQVDDHLGWMVLADGAYSVRELSPYKESFPAQTLTTTTKMRELAQQWGVILATAHARADQDSANSGIGYSVDAAIDAATDGKHTAFRTQVRSIALGYAQQVKTDYASFVGQMAGSCP